MKKHIINVITVSECKKFHTGFPARPALPLSPFIPAGPISPDSPFMHQLNMKDPWIIKIKVNLLGFRGVPSFQAVLLVQEVREDPALEEYVMYSVV